MILTCPNCSTRFNFPKEGLGKTGVKVRCTECLEVWHQDPIDDKAEDEAIEDVSTQEETDTHDDATEFVVKDDTTEIENDAPEKLEQEPEDNSTEEKVGQEEETLPEDAHDNDSEEEGAEESREEEKQQESSEDSDQAEDGTTELATEKNDEGKREILQNKMANKKLVSIGVAVFIFVISFIVLLLFNDTMMKKYTSMHAFYSLLGMGMEVPGEDLVFDKVTSTLTANELHIEGKIVNLGREVREIPLIEASIRDKDNHVTEAWYIEPPKHSAEGEEELIFTSEYKLHKEANENFKKHHDIHFRFVLKQPENMMHEEQDHHEEKSAHKTEDTHKEASHADKAEHHDGSHAKTDAASGDNTHAHH